MGICNHEPQLRLLFATLPTSWALALMKVILKCLSCVSLGNNYVTGGLFTMEIALKFQDVHHFEL